MYKSLGLSKAFSIIQWIFCLIGAPFCFSLTLREFWCGLSFCIALLFFHFFSMVFSLRCWSVWSRMKSSLLLFGVWKNVVSFWLLFAWLIWCDGVSLYNYNFFISLRWCLVLYFLYLKYKHNCSDSDKYKNLERWK